MSISMLRELLPKSGVWMVLCGFLAVGGLRCGVAPVAEPSGQELPICISAEPPVQPPSKEIPQQEPSSEPSTKDSADASLPEPQPEKEADTPAPQPDEPGAVEKTSPEFAPEPAPEVPKDISPNALGPIYKNPTHKVLITRGVPFAQGMVYHPTDSSRSYPINLTLDIYEPDDKHGQKRPVIVFLHGGGFWTGDSLMDSMVSGAKYFAQRGWVGFSVNYRLHGHLGIAPKNWPSNRPTYGAARDVKAAVRWIRANASQYRIHPDYIAAYGGSAGAYISIALGASDEKDFKDELLTDPEENKLLQNTHLTQSSKVQAVVAHWGAGLLLELLESYDQRNRFDVNDAPLMIVHGSADTTVPYTEATKLQQNYKASVELYRLDGAGHSAWGSSHNGTPVVQKVQSFLQRKFNITAQ